MKKWINGTLMVVLALALTACGSSNGTNSNGSNNSNPAGSEENNQSGVTVLKVAQNIIPNPPYSYMNEQDVMEGYTVEYLKLLDEHLEDYEFQYEQISREAMLVGVETGKYDLAANFYYRNPEREAKYAFGEQEYGYALNALIVKSDRNDIKSLDDMRGKTLTPMNPALGLKIMVDDYNEKNADNPINVTNVDKVTDAESLKWVADGKYDAFFVNKNNFDTINAELKLDLKIATLVTKEPIWVLFNKDNAELTAVFDAATKELIEDGTLPKLSEEWFGADLFKPLEEVNETYSFQ